MFVGYYSPDVAYVDSEPSEDGSWVRADDALAEIAALRAKIDAVRKTATAYCAMHMMSPIGVRLFNDLGEEPPAKDPK